MSSHAVDLIKASHVSCSPNYITWFYMFQNGSSGLPNPPHVSIYKIATFYVCTISS